MSDWWTDYRQNTRIRDLQGEVDSAYSYASYAAERSRALQSKLSEVQGTLERRLDRLATSFDAFVELSDLRLELAVFDREAAVRHRTRRLLMRLAQGATDPPPLDLEDCPSYWLKPAAEALSALVRDDKVAAEKFAAEAGARDEHRTTLFLTLALATAGQHTRAVSWLARALPPLGTTVTTVQRRLWVACADGAFGDPGREYVGRRLTELLDELPADVAADERGRWRQAAAVHAGKPSRSTLPRELQKETALTEPPANAERLAQLRARVEEALRPADAAPPPDFANLLNTLIDEGSPDERPLVARARELRQIIEQGGGEQPVAWDSPAGETLDLIRGDIFQQGPPGPRALAARAGGRWVSAIADDLAEKASVRPPDTLDVRVHGHSLRIGSNGAVSLGEAEAEIDGVTAVSPAVERIGLALAVIGAVVLVPGMAAGLAGLTFLAGVVAIAGGVLWAKQALERRQAREAADDDKERLARQAEEIAEALKKCHSRQKDLAAGAAADRDAILTLLA